MEDLIQLITNNGIGIVCVGYLMYFQSTTMKTISESLSTMVNTLTLMNERLNDIEHKIEM